jgi:hypothetical protein
MMADGFSSLTNPDPPCDQDGRAIMGKPFPSRMSSIETDSADTSKSSSRLTRKFIGNTRSTDDFSWSCVPAREKRRCVVRLRFDSVYQRIPDGCQVGTVEGHLRQIWQPNWRWRHRQGQGIRVHREEPLVPSNREACIKSLTVW